MPRRRRRSQSSPSSLPVGLTSLATVVCGCILISTRVESEGIRKTDGRVVDPIQDETMSADYSKHRTHPVIPRPKTSASAPMVEVPPATSPSFIDDQTDMTPVPKDETSSTKAVVTQQDFVEWCKSMHIHTNLSIHDFEYYDFLEGHLRSAHQWETSSDDDDNWRDTANMMGPPVEDADAPLSTVSVRGLAASQNITAGQVVISIPFDAMIAVSTTIDADPVLQRVLGQSIRQQHGWEDEYYEMPLLTLALLYHKALGKASPLYHYIQILETAPTQQFPFLWSKETLRQTATEGIRRIARGIAKGIEEIYDTMVPLLRDEFPELFDSSTYSKSNFYWAFAMVNSRHWHLPIPDYDSGIDRLDNDDNEAQQQQEHHALSTSEDQMPPAAEPTEDWIEEHELSSSRAFRRAQMKPHSFLAPIADLLNFGPPCTRGVYNLEREAFELIATCDFEKGQELTYWYSSDCEDVVIANYGFTHPMVPACPSLEDYKESSELWKQRSDVMEKELEAAYDDLERLEMEMEQLLERCNCGDSGGDDGRKNHSAGDSRKMKSTKERRHTTQQPQQHDYVRGNHHNNDDDDVGGGVRRKWTHQKSDLGL